MKNNMKNLEYYISFPILIIGLALFTGGQAWHNYTVSDIGVIIMMIGMLPILIASNINNKKQ